MSKVCQVCLKGPVSGNNVSHSKRHTKRRFLPNLIQKRIFDPLSNAFVKIKVCTRCNRTMLKQESKKIEKAMASE